MIVFAWIFNPELIKPNKIIYHSHRNTTSMQFKHKMDIKHAFD